MSRPLFVTLGPNSCHEHALRHYLEFQGVEADLEFVDDLLVGLERVRRHPHAFLLQCSAHPDVHIVTERYFNEVFVVDTFLFPTRELALLRRADVERPRTLGIVDALTGYIDMSPWTDVVYEPFKARVGEGLLAGKYDAGVTYVSFAHDHPRRLVVELEIGAVDTTWIVYGRRKRFAGELIGTRCPEIYEAPQRSRRRAPASSTSSHSGRRPSRPRTAAS